MPSVDGSKPIPDTVFLRNTSLATSTSFEPRVLHGDESDEVPTQGDYTHYYFQNDFDPQAFGDVEFDERVASTMLHDQSLVDQSPYTSFSAVTEVATTQDEIHLDDISGDTSDVAEALSEPHLASLEGEIPFLLPDQEWLLDVPSGFHSSSRVQDADETSYDGAVFPGPPPGLPNPPQHKKVITTSTQPDDEVEISSPITSPLPLRMELRASLTEPSDDDDLLVNNKPSVLPARTVMVSEVSSTTDIILPWLRTLPPPTDSPDWDNFAFTPEPSPSPPPDGGWSGYDSETWSSCESSPELSDGSLLLEIAADLSQLFIQDVSKELRLNFDYTKFKTYDELRASIVVK